MGLFSSGQGVSFPLFEVRREVLAALASWAGDLPSSAFVQAFSLFNTFYVLYIWTLIENGRVSET